MPGNDPGFKVNPYNSPTLLVDMSALPLPVAAITPATPQGTTTNSGAGDFASRVGGIGGGTAKAARQFDPQTTITQGTLIPRCSRPRSTPTCPATSARS